MNKVYVVFKDEILHMCYDITVFDSVHATVESAEKRVKEINMYESGTKAWYEANNVINT